MLEGAAGAYRDTVLLNAAAALVVAGKVDELRDGAAVAAQVIDSGAALGGVGADAAGECGGVGESAAGARTLRIEAEDCEEGGPWAASQSAGALPNRLVITDLSSVASLFGSVRWSGSSNRCPASRR